MFEINKIEIDWCGKKLTLETGKWQGKQMHR